MNCHHDFSMELPWTYSIRAAFKAMLSANKVKGKQNIPYVSCDYTGDAEIKSGLMIKKNGCPVMDNHLITT